MKGEHTPDGRYAVTVWSPGSGSASMINLNAEEKASLIASLVEDPTLTEELLHADVEKIRAYALGLRAWTRYHDSPVAQIATDILYLIGET